MGGAVARLSAVHHSNRDGGRECPSPRRTAWRTPTYRQSRFLVRTVHMRACRRFTRLGVAVVWHAQPRSEAYAAHGSRQRRPTRRYLTQSRPQIKSGSAPFFRHNRIHNEKQAARSASLARRLSHPRGPAPWLCPLLGRFVSHACLPLGPDLPFGLCPPHLAPAGPPAPRRPRSPARSGAGLTLPLPGAPPSAVALGLPADYGESKSAARRAHVARAATAAVDLSAAPPLHGRRFGTCR